MKLRRYSFIIYWIIVLGLLALFFTNDFGLVDITKTSIIPAVGIDVEGEEVVVTAQIAMPKPSQSGDNVEYTEVQGCGMTVADALNEINVKTGFYPELQFCKLVLIGEDCKERNLFRLLGCFYRKNYSELTALVAMCKGKAGDMLAMKTPSSDMTSSAIQRALAEELTRSANVSTVSLKDIAVDNFSKSGAAYMPFVEANKQGTSKSGGDGDDVGGEPAGDDKSQGSGSGNSSEGGQQGQGQGEGEQGNSAKGTDGSSNKGKDPVEFSARKTAMFRQGMFVGLLDEQQSFALNVLKNSVKYAILPCSVGETNYTIAFRDVDGGIKLEVNDGGAQLTLSFKAAGYISGIKKVVDPKETTTDDVLPPEVIKGAEREIENRFSALVEATVANDCDILGVKKMLYGSYNSRYEGFKDNLLSDMKVNYKVKVLSTN